MIEIIMHGSWKEYIDLVMMVVAVVWFLVLVYIFGRAAWKWASEPFRIAHQLEEQLKELDH